MKSRCLPDSFKQGDLLYGLESERTFYRSALRKSAVASKYPMTVDELNNKIFLSGKPKGLWSTDTHASVWAYLKDTKNNGLDADTLPLYEQHLRLMENTTHTKLSLTRNDYPENVKQLAPKIRARIRACKLAMLEYPLKTNATIHFILDKIDLRHVVDRNFSATHSPTKRHAPRDADILHDSYTNAELRFVFKHYEEIVENNRALVFYENRQEINLFTWINKQPAAAKSAFMEYAIGKKLGALLKNLEEMAVSEQVDQLEEKLANETFEMPVTNPNQKTLIGSSHRFLTKQIESANKEPINLLGVTPSDLTDGESSPQNSMSS